MTGADSDASERRLLDLVGANWTTQAIGAAVALGVIDGLAQRPRRADELARDLGCDPAALQRLLRALVAIDVCATDGDARHALTRLGTLLREDVPGSVRAWALWCSGPQWALWGDLAASVRTGRSVRDRAGAASGYAHLERDSAAADVFNRAMAGLSGRIGRSVARAVDWRGARRVVDVGGGYGELLVEVLRARPNLRGTVFDLPHATRSVAGRLARAGLSSRCAVATGSFFDAVPEGGDVYLLKSVLHNWDDDRAREILKRCRAALRVGARLIIVERVLPERRRAGRRERAIVRSDLNMLVSLGGRERTAREFERMLAETGFGRPRLTPIVLDYSVIEAAAVVGPPQGRRA